MVWHTQEVTHTKGMPARAQNGGTPSVHYVPGAVLGTSHTDSSRPHNPGGGFPHAPSEPSSPHGASVDRVTLNTTTHGEERKPKAQGGRKSHEILLQGIPTEKKKRPMGYRRPRERAQVINLTRIIDEVTGKAPSGRRRQGLPAFTFQRQFTAIWTLLVSNDRFITKERKLVVLPYQLRARLMTS